MIKQFLLPFLMILSSMSFAQADNAIVSDNRVVDDSLLQGKWELFKIIDNMTGEEILPSHKSNAEHIYYINFAQGDVSFNLEMNTCTNEYNLGLDNEFSFKYYDSCSKICCDGDFSKNLNYEDCTKYFLKNINILVLVSEDRIYYFNRKAPIKE